MASTGRRFIGCPRKGSDRCSFIVWVDEPWNPVLSRALLKLWRLVDDGGLTIDQPYLDLWNEKNDLEMAFEQRVHKFEIRELRLKETIRKNSTKASWLLKLYANICLALLISRSFDQGLYVLWTPSVHLSSSRTRLIRMDCKVHTLSKFL